MKSFEYTVTDAIGLHARPAGMLVQKSKKYSSRITICANGKECESTRLMALMTMGIKQGTSVKVLIEGEDEAVCKTEIEQFFCQNL